MLQSFVSMYTLCGIWADIENVYIYFYEQRSAAQYKLHRLSTNYHTRASEFMCCVQLGETVHAGG